jgi:hypothetical protein
MASRTLPPKACILQQDMSTYCGRVVSDQEFVFRDAAYAVRIYANANGTCIRACPNCVEVWSSFVSRDAGGAVRGMGGDK